MSQAKADPKAMANDFVTGGLSQAEIARKYGLTPASVSERARREDWKGQRLAFQNSLARRSYEKVAESVANEKAQHVTEAIAVARATLRRYAQQLAAGQVNVTPKDAAMMAELLVKTLDPDGVPNTDESRPVIDVSPDSAEFLRRAVEAARGRLNPSGVLEGTVLEGAKGTRPN